MSITLKQLAALAEEFDFDYLEARQFLGHNVSQKRGRPAKKSSDSDSDDEKPVKKCTGGSCKKPTSSSDKPKGKRGPTGYNLFMAANSSIVTAKLKKKAGGDPLPRGAAAAEIGKVWKALSEKQREAWNEKAKK